MPNKIALFVRDETNLPTNIQKITGDPSPQKQMYAYECDFKDAPRLTTKVH